MVDAVSFLRVAGSFSGFFKLFFSLPLRTPVKGSVSCGNGTKLRERKVALKEAKSRKGKTR